MHVSDSSVFDYDDHTYFLKHHIIVIILNFAHHNDDHDDKDTDNDEHFNVYVCNSIKCT
jgi:hypothetical protein